ncbi:methyltransferase domain-containing protein [Arcobacter sp.]|uniref:methyltransferase domain-containing protein n=1 Tax=Arcobacter sp. TaxID=1872629 RepID=UPI003D11D5AB
MNKKNLSELKYWQNRYDIENNYFQNSWFKKNMLRMSEEDENFFTDKVVADFGCGPRGSLEWIKNSKVNIGIDVNTDLYADNFKNSIINHNMLYVKSTENVIPIPDNYVDILFTINAIDHVNNLEIMVNELIRILKPNGIFAGYFNLEEPASDCEPQRLTEELISNLLENKLNIEVYKTSIIPKAPNDKYDALHDEKEFEKYTKGDIGLLWIKGTKK